MEILPLNKRGQKSKCLDAVGAMDLMAPKSQLDLQKKVKSTFQVRRSSTIHMVMVVYRHLAKGFFRYVVDL